MAIIAPQYSNGFHSYVYAGPKLVYPSTGHRAEDMSTHLEYRILPDDRWLYGMKGMAIYASSHPSEPFCLTSSSRCYWTPIKNVFAIGTGDLDAEFTEFYENIHDNIVSSILAALPDSEWGLNVLRLGFDSDPLKNPITLHLVAAHNGGLSEEIACRIVADILSIITAAPYSNQSIHIDVCRAFEVSQDINEQLPFSLLDGNPELYNSSSRLPGSSIGPVQFNCAGTLTGYVQHTDERGTKSNYGLLSKHVADSNNVFRNAGRITSLLSLTCPAKCDHTRMIEKISNKVAVDAYSLQNEITPLGKTLDNAKAYNITFGNVYATSGTGRLLKDFNGRSDWALVLITNPNVIAENKHVSSSSSFVSFEHEVVRPLTVDFIGRATQHFNPGPYFKPVRVDDLSPAELVFKPRSRTTSGWIGGTFNAIRSTQNLSSVPTRECCFIALERHRAMSARGDSGSIILDKEFRPVAMIWGGGPHSFAYGPQDVTYASPLSKVLRDIEECIGGSVSMI